MIKFRDEGECIESGVNIYPLSSIVAVGFLFRCFGRTWVFRFSKRAGRFDITYLNALRRIMTAIQDH